MTYLRYDLYPGAKYQKAIILLINSIPPDIINMIPTIWNPKSIYDLVFRDAAVIFPGRNFHITKPTAMIMIECNIKHVLIKFFPSPFPIYARICGSEISAIKIASSGMFWNTKPIQI